jgi:hypothetical protein
LRQLSDLDSKTRGGRLVPATCAAALVLVVATLAFRHPASIWSMTDYEMDSLSGAINLAYRLGDFRFYPAESLENHPGVPHYILSWIALALAGFPFATSQLGFFRDVLQHVERFHFIMMALSALTGAAGLYLLMRAAQKIAPVGVALIGILLWFGSTPYSLLSFMTLSIDCLGPILSALFLMLLWRIANEPRLTPSTMVLAGLLSAAAYLTKLSYINLPIGLCAAIGLVILAGRGSRGRMFLMLLLFDYAVVIGVLLVAVWVIEWSSFRALLNFHSSVIFHSGSYGADPSEIVSGSELRNAIASIPADRTWAIPIALAAGLVLMVASGATAILKSDRLPAAILAMGAGVASVFSALSVLKHYGAFYSAAVAYTLPACCVAAYVMLDAWNIRPRGRALTGALVALALCIPALSVIRAADATMQNYWRRSQDADADYKVIAGFIDKASGTAPVGFGYAVPFREYAEGFLLIDAGIPGLTYQYLTEPAATISCITQRFVARDIGVFVIDKTRFPTAQSIEASDNFNPIGPVAKYQAGDQLIELKTAFVLVRKQPGRGPRGTGG